MGNVEPVLRHVALTILAALAAGWAARGTVRLAAKDFRKAFGTPGLRRIPLLCVVVTMAAMSVWTAMSAAEKMQLLRGQTSEARLYMPVDSSQRTQPETNLNTTIETDWREIRHWNYGVFEGSEKIAFDDGWAFPCGTNRLKSIELVSYGEVLPDWKSQDAIASLGRKLSIVPAVTSFRYGRTPSNTYAFVWNNAWDGRIDGTPFDGRIELFRNGDVSVSTNGVTVLRKYVNPYDTDGDGLADSIDPEPTICGGDFSGTGIEWLNANCGAVLSAAPGDGGRIEISWKEGADPGAYCWLAFTSLADNNRITATCDGPSDLGNLEIIANSNQTCRIPLLAGAKYTVRPDDATGGVSASDEDATITERNDGGYDVEFPETLSFAAPETDGESVVFRLTCDPARIAPEIVSVTGNCCCIESSLDAVRFVCDGECGCEDGNLEFTALASWEGYSRAVRNAYPRETLLEARRAAQEIRSAILSIQIRDAAGNPVQWRNPVLEGDALQIEIAASPTAEVDAARLEGLLSGRLRLRAYAEGFNGRHVFSDAILPFTASSISSPGSGVFRIPVPSGWLSDAGLVSGGEDGVACKTSIDVYDIGDGSSREDGDIFDENAPGILAGRVRGTEGNPSAAIPEAAAGTASFRAAGTAMLVACAPPLESQPVLCQRQADLLYYSGHGDHSSGMLGGFVVPADISDRWNTVRTAIFAGCSVLDIDDMNGNYAAPADHAASPGRKWIAASGADVMLGYAFSRANAFE